MQHLFFSVVFLMSVMIHVFKLGAARPVKVTLQKKSKLSNAQLELKSGSSHCGWSSLKKKLNLSTRERFSGERPIAELKTSTAELNPKVAQ